MERLFFGPWRRRTALLPSGFWAFILTAIGIGSAMALVLFGRTDGAGGPPGRIVSRLAGWLEQDDGLLALSDAVVSRQGIAGGMVALALLATALRRWEAALLACAGPLLAVQVTERLWKNLLAPEGLARSPFPSGHATAAVALCFALFVGLSPQARRYAWTIVPLAVMTTGGALLGMATVVANGTHDVRDALGGGLAAVFGVALAASLIWICATALDRRLRSLQRVHDPSADAATAED